MAPVLETGEQALDPATPLVEFPVFAGGLVAAAAGWYAGRNALALGGLTEPVGAWPLALRCIRAGRHPRNSVGAPFALFICPGDRKKASADPTRRRSRPALSSAHLWSVRWPMGVGRAFETLVALRWAVRWGLSIMITSSSVRLGRESSPTKILARTPLRDQRTNRL